MTCWRVAVRACMLAYSRLACLHACVLTCMHAFALTCGHGYVLTLEWAQIGHNSETLLQAFA